MASFAVPACPFDAALFDLDGTLVATDRFWVQAARVGARRAFRDLGLERDLPEASAWMGLVGQPLADGFRELFPDLTAEQRDRVREACELEEHRLLASGGDVLMPGAADVLRELRAGGARIGVASNCSRAYLDHMLGPMGLGALVDEALCLDSPGVRTKTDMIRRLLDGFGTRRAFMVGDREGDRNAAWANGLPHVHCAFGFASGTEDVSSEATLFDLGELPEVLGGRRRGLERIVEGLRLGVLGPPGRPPILGIGGPPAAGKSLLAAELLPLLEEALGREVGLLDPAGLGEPGLERVLDERSRGETPELEVRTARGRGRLPAGGVLLVEGRELLEPSHRSRLDRLLWVTAPDDLLLLRVAARAAGPGAARALAEAREGLARARSLEERYPPRLHADGVADGTNPLRPGPVERDPRPGA